MKKSAIREFLQRFAMGSHTVQEHELFIHWLQTSTDDEVEEAARAYEAILRDQAGPRPADNALMMKVERWLDEAERATRRMGEADRMKPRAGEADHASRPMNEAEPMPPRTGEADHAIPQTVENAPRRIRWIAIAAAVLLLLATAGMYWLTRPSPPAFMQAGHIIKTVPPRDTAVILLEDGSRIVLNGGSTLQYLPSYRNKPIREVYLSGEAYFEIKHNDHQPFVIHTRDMDIVDLGTIFNIKAYPGEALTETTLLEGAIEVRMKDGSSKKVLLKPLEKVSYYNPDTLLAGAVPAVAGQIELPELEIKPIAPATAEHIVEETAWMNNLLVFHDKSFAELATSMERRFNVVIRFSGAAVKAYRYTGIFRDESIEQALHELQLSRPFNYTTRQDTIFIDQ